MASTTQNIGLKTYDISTDNFADFTTGTSQNMVAIDKAISDKVKLNGESLSNVNFILNEIVKDGLMSSGVNVLSQINTQSMYSAFNFISMKFEHMKSNATKYLLGISSNANIAVDTNNNLLINTNGKYITISKDLPQGEHIIRISKNKDKLVFDINGVKTEVQQFEADGKIILGGYIDGFGSLNGDTIKWYNIYNRPLTSQEITHNISILNNTPSINRINDCTISTDTDHIEDRTGRVQDTINRVFYKNMCKEFSSDGSAITVNNGMDGYLLSAKIEGQTVKNIAKSNDRYYNGTSAITTSTSVPMCDVSLIDNTKQYSILFRVNEIVSPVTGAMIGLKGKGVKTIDFTTTGVYAVYFDTSQTSDLYTYINAKGSNGSFKIDKVVVVDGIVDKSNIDNIQLGLNSTQATITNNGMKYSFYLPTIDGKTRVMRALKGTQNWVEIDASEVRDTVTYDYKLVSNSDLGSVPSAYDYIDRARKVKVFNTKQMMLDGSENWQADPQGTGGYGIKLNLSDGLVNLGSFIKGKIVCDKLVSIDTYDKDVTGANYGWGNNIYIKFSSADLANATLQTAKEKLKTMGITVRYQLATPIEVPMTDEEIKTYDTYRKVIDLGGLEGARNTWELKEDGSGVYTNNFGLCSITGDEEMAYFSIQNGVAGVQIKNLIGVNAKVNGASINIGGVQQSNYIEIASAVGYRFFNQNSLIFNVNATSLKTQDSAGLRLFLKENPNIIYYQLATTVVTTIPKELVPTILTQATNTFTFGDAVAPYSVTIKVPTTDDITKSYTVTLLNGYTQTPSTATPVVNLANTGIVRLQMDLTAPSTTPNATLFTLPLELRPITTQKIPVFVNGVCQLATIDKTTGNVNLPSVPSANANIYIKTDYRRDI